MPFTETNPLSSLIKGRKIPGEKKLVSAGKNGSARAFFKKIRRTEMLRNKSTQKRNRACARFLMPSMVSLDSIHPPNVETTLHNLFENRGYG